MCQCVAGWSDISVLGRLFQLGSTIKIQLCVFVWYKDNIIINSLIVIAIILQLKYCSIGELQHLLIYTQNNTFYAFDLLCVSKRQKKPKGQSRMNNPEIREKLGTHNTERSLRQQQKLRDYKKTQISDFIPQFLAIQSV